MRLFGFTDNKKLSSLIPEDSKFNFRFESDDNCLLKVTYNPKTSDVYMIVKEGLDKALKRIKAKSFRFLFIDNAYHIVIKSGRALHIVKIYVRESNYYITFEKATKAGISWYKTLYGRFEKCFMLVDGEEGFAFFGGKSA